MSDDGLGFLVVARVPAPRSQHAWTYEPLSAVSFDLGKVQQCFESVCDPKRKRPAHPDADGYVLAELVPVSLDKPVWIERDLLDNPPAPRVRNERLSDFIDLDKSLDEHRRITI